MNYILSCLYASYHGEIPLADLAELGLGWVCLTTPNWKYYPDKFFFIGEYLFKRNRYWLIPSRDIDDHWDIDASCWTEHISVYNWELWVPYRVKTLSLFSKSINFSFWTIFNIFNMAIPPDQLRVHLTNLDKLGCGWACLTTPNQKYDLQSFLSLMNIYDLQKTLVLC